MVALDCNNSSNIKLCRRIEDFFPCPLDRGQFVSYDLIELARMSELVVFIDRTLIQ